MFYWSCADATELRTKEFEEFVFILHVSLSEFHHEVLL